MRITGVKLLVYTVRGRPSKGVTELLVDPRQVLDVRRDRSGKISMDLDIPDGRERYILNGVQACQVLLDAGRTDLFRRNG